MRNSFKTAGLAAASFCLTTGIVGVLAQPAAASEFTVIAPIEEVRTEQVSVRGLDLSQSKDMKRLHRRILSASRRVCDDPVDRIISAQELSCRQSAIAGAEPQIAQLVNHARSLAAAGSPVEITTTVAVIAPE